MKWQRLSKKELLLDYNEFVTVGIQTVGFRKYEITIFGAHFQLVFKQSFTQLRYAQHWVEKNLVSLLKLMGEEKDE